MSSSYIWSLVYSVIYQISDSCLQKNTFPHIRVVTEVAESHQENMLFLLHPFAKCDTFCITFACFRRSGHTYKRKEKVREMAFATFAYLFMHK